MVCSICALRTAPVSEQRDQWRMKNYRECYVVIYASRYGHWPRWERGIPYIHKVSTLPENLGNESMNYWAAKHRPSGLQWQKKIQWERCNNFCPYIDISIFRKYTKFCFTSIFIWVTKLDSNSFTKTKNWSGRNEVIETSGRLHPLWPQDKRLHTPRTTDYRHSRQDRWIQTELVSTLAKNATKPNPFEIILLQTTRKENNWKTEETLERAVVTLETERVKGSNPWC